jgi:nucleotide-binding universal stress UspA family protein
MEIHLSGSHHEPSVEWSFLLGWHVIKTILIPTSGSDADRSVFETALAVGGALGSHLSFCHAKITAAAAAVQAHLEFCQDGELADALEGLREREQACAVQAREHFETFCRTNGIRVDSLPGGVDRLSASWVERTGQAEHGFLFHARHHDLVVLGRRHSDFLATGLIETLLVQSGRPLIIAPSSPRTTIKGTIVVGWKETAEAARSVAFALPLLKQATTVILLGVSERDSASGQALVECARQLAWHGIIADVEVIGDGSRSAAIELTEAATRRHAELLVVGGFGHGELRELLFGGVTRALIDDAELPVFMAH